ncbi:MAG TPA: Ig-like domain-containing protein [Thermoplasmata archaeon]|nr:Ig-like domain-containing protein [Thermoplasmata archaeon]
MATVLAFVAPVQAVAPGHFPDDGSSNLPVLGFLTLEDAQAALADISNLVPASPLPSHPSNDPPFEASLKVSGPPDRQIIGEYDEWVAPDGTIVSGWISVQGGVGCGFSTSADEGKTWSAPFYATGSQGGGDPVITPDASVPGAIYILCIVDATGAGNGKNVIAFSSDSGKTWSNWDRTLSWSQYTADHPMMVANNGKLLQIINQGQGSTDVVVSSDGGKTWGSPKNLAGGMPSCIEFDKQRNKVWVVTGHGPLGGGTTSYGVTSSDFGGTWSSAVSVGLKGDARWDCDFDKATGELYALTMSSTAVTLVHSADDGKTWDKNTVASGSFGDWSDGQRTWPPWASVAVGNDGALHAGWLSNEGGYFEAFYSKSTDKGKTWASKTKVSDQAKYTCAIGGSTCRTAHYGHGLVITKTGVPCFGWVLPVGNAMEYRHSCNRSGGGGGGGGIARVDVTPASASITADQTRQFSAQAFDAQGKQVNSTFTWSASAGSVDQSGLYTPQKTGAHSVDATAVGGTKGSAQVTVAHGTQVSMQVSPQAPTIQADQTLKFALDAVDAKGNAWQISPASWAVSGAGAGNIDASGLYTPQKTGTFTIEATDPSNSQKATTSVTVSPGAVSTVSVSPKAVSITADDTQQFSANALDSKGNPVSSGITWSASGGGVSPGGLYSPGKTGTFTVSATAGSISDSASVTVSPGKLAIIAVEPPTKTITADDTLSLTASGEDAKGNAIALSPTWTAEDGEVSSSGLFTPTAVGKWKVTATQDEVSGSAEITVTPGAVAKVTLDPASKEMAKGDSVGFQATAEDAKGNLITTGAKVEWKLAGDNIGQLDQNGKLVAKGAGEATVKATVSYGGSSEVGEAKVFVRGGLLDLKGGGQLPMLLMIALAAVIGLVAVGAVAARRKRKAREAAAAQSRAQGQGWGQGPEQWPAYPDFGSEPEPGPGPGAWQSGPPQAPPGPGGAR